MANLVNVRQNLARYITTPLIGKLSKIGVKPNTLTLANLVFSIAAGYFIATGHFIWGSLLILVSGLFDLLDGALARLTKSSTKFGAILDSVVDRISESVILFGLLVWYIPQNANLEIILIFVILIGAFLVSYIRARAEGLGLQCQVGLFTRAERVIVLAIGFLINQIFITLCILVFFILITVIQRLVYLLKQESKGD